MPSQETLQKTEAASEAAQKRLQGEIESLRAYGAKVRFTLDLYPPSTSPELPQTPSCMAA